MEMFLAKMLAVLVLGVIELWVAIPTGFALGLHPIVTGAAAAIGAIAGAAAVVLLGEPARALLLARLHSGNSDEEGQQKGNIHRIWLRYGIAGLGLLSPLLIGAPLGTALGVALGAPKGRLLFWMSAGVVLWSAGLTVAGTLGLAGIGALAQR